MAPGSLADAVRRFESGSRVPGWDTAADLDKDPAVVPDLATTPVPQELVTLIDEYMSRYPDRRSASIPALRAAQTLSTRYNAKVGMIKSWDDKAYAGKFETNIDALMNTELLFWAAANGGSSTYRTMAVSHASRALTDLVRPDGSTAAAPRLSSRCSTLEVPGIGSITGERRSSQASAS